MSRTRTITTLAIAVVLSAPAAAATWLSYGTFEPDTSADVGFQWGCPPFVDADASDGCDLTSAAIKNRVYFNVFPKYGDATGSNNAGEINPNVGALETRMDPAGQYTFYGILGVWIDCNRDGYIGLAETAVREYSSNVPGIDKTICPDNNGKSRIAWNGEPNYNGWVTEFIAIGSRERSNADLRLLGDDGAMVWGDPGAPGADVDAPGAQCTTLPHRYDGRSTGGFIYTLDCRGQDGRVQQYNDATAGTGLEFEDTDPRDSSHPANQAPSVLFGDDCTTNTGNSNPDGAGSDPANCGSDHAAVHVQDCSAAPIAEKPATFPGAGDAADTPHDHLVRPVPANPVNTDVNSWTIGGQLNATNEELGPQPRATNDDQNRKFSTSNCDTTDDEGNDWYELYEDRPGAVSRGKDGATWNFAFVTATRGSIPANAVSSGGSGATTDLGVPLLGAECTASSCQQSGWLAGTEASTITTTKGNVGEDKDGDGADDATEFGPGLRWSFYAKVTDTFLNGGWQLPGGTGVYGSEQCTGDTTGVSAGNWDCKASNWYRRADGSAIEEPRPFARVHDGYNLRDVDCADGSIGSTGLTTSLGSMGDDAC